MISSLGLWKPGAECAAVRNGLSVSDILMLGQVRPRDGFLWLNVLSGTPRIDLCHKLFRWEWPQKTKVVLIHIQIMGLLILGQGLKSYILIYETCFQNNLKLSYCDFLLGKYFTCNKKHNKNTQEWLILTFISAKVLDSWAVAPWSPAALGQDLLRGIKWLTCCGTNGRPVCSGTATVAQSNDL